MLRPGGQGRHRKTAKQAKEERCANRQGSARICTRGGAMPAVTAWLSVVIYIFKSSFTLRAPADEIEYNTSYFKVMS